MAPKGKIDTESLERALALSGETGTRAAEVARASRGRVARRDQARIVELFGTLEWSGAYDPKVERERDRGGR